MKKTLTPTFVERLEALLEEVPENCSMVIGMTVLDKDDDPEDPMISLEHIVAYRGEYCAEAIFGVLQDETLIEAGVIDGALEHWTEALKLEEEERNARSWDEADSVSDSQDGEGVDAVGGTEDSGEGPGQAERAGT